jgi:pimeloyl-ACP methyl ester carboxylesterase
MKAMATDLASRIRQRLLAELPVTERTLTLNGIETAVLEGGEGQPVVLLHGPGAYGAHWQQVIPELARSHRVIAPDLPGHGASGYGPEATIPEQVNGWLDDLIECTCESAPVLVGHTLGGAIAARFVADNGKRVRALILVDTLGLVQFQPTPEFGAALVAFLSKPDEQTHDGLWRQCVFDYARMQGRIGARWPLMRHYNLLGAQRPGGIAAIGAWMEHIGSPAISAEMLSRIRVPTSLIWGREDRATALAAAAQASARFGWPLHVIDGAADDPTIEQPEEFLRVLRVLLAAA